jgi:broad specificity phosphatase PhoE
VRVLLIRHGESESNAGLPSSVPGSSPLTELGRRQAERVAASFAGPPSLIVSSSYVRAQQTAAPTVSRFSDVPYEEWPVQEFTYLGTLHDQAMTAEERRPIVLRYWALADPVHRNGGAESFADLVGRTEDCLNRLDALRATHELVAVFTHGLFIRALVWCLMNGTTNATADLMRSYQRFASLYVTPNGCIVELGFGDRPTPYILGGSTAHLPADLLSGIR